MLSTLLIMIAALLVDAWLGEPRRAHPLVAFGSLAGAVERGLNPTAARPGWETRGRGVLALTLLLLPPVGLCAWLLPQLSWGALVEVVGLYLCVGRQSLRQHVLAIAAPLQSGDLPRARIATAMIVSRDTEQMDSPGMARAAVESTLENGHDALFATLFWFLVAGLPGALLHRLVNTLDAMWGYRTSRYVAFGWAAARADDLLGWPPARLTTIGYCLCGRYRQGMQCWRSQAHLHDSPNAGPVMAAGAGALSLELGGPAYYHGELRARPRFGGGRPARVADIGRALALVDRVLLLWLVSLGLLGVVSGLMAAVVAP